ncbi:hypothetical protein HU200_000564 [Digitaria exilis]|uniref:Uncharacterized protein n=1 Tax=Digitaria exilis TaxID=1010633 RepID=A0A835G2S5_9POAL|nr:hypothetical protein HU200_000564 [Digitaria exilis]
MAGIPARQSWPDLLHTHCDYAHKAIQQDRPDLRVINMIVDYDPEPRIEEFDRVIVWCIDDGSDYIVDRVPTQG